MKRLALDYERGLGGVSWIRMTSRKIEAGGVGDNFFGNVGFAGTRDRVGTHAINNGDGIVVGADG